MAARFWLWVCVVVALLAVAAEASADSVNAELVRYYSVKKNYRKVRHDVLDWHRTTRNGCVAFVSTALRHVGVAVPRDAKRDGWGVSRITFTFADYLEKDLGWTRVEDVAALEPGDVVFTEGWPDHVFVFESWKSRRRKIARAIDNQRFTHARALLPEPDSEVSAFAYALRAPLPPADDEADGEQAEQQ